MYLRINRVLGGLIPMLAAAIYFGGLAASFAQTAPTPAKQPGDGLTWDSLLKEQSPMPGQATADFIFGVTNITASPVVIGRLQPSCGCTTAKLPTSPWVLLPGTNSVVNVSVNLQGKFGTLVKTVTVFSTNNEIMKVLTVRVNMPDTPEMMRTKNQQLAKGDAQAVFKGDCAKCHVEKWKGKMGKELYVEACGICHEAKPRATMVPDLHNLNHPTFYGYWRMIIAEGKPKTLMPAFAIDHGGPMTEAQIDSLAKVLTAAFPSKEPVPAMAPTGNKNAMLQPPANLNVKPN